MKVTFYETGSGRSPVIDYIQNLDNSERADLLDALQRVKKDGLNATQVKFRPIQGKLWEIKATYHRIFYVLLMADEMILLHSYKKQSQKLPIGERDIAIRRMKEIIK